MSADAAVSPGARDGTGRGGGKLGTDAEIRWRAVQELLASGAAAL
ncbi:hypothetical protein BJY54_005218 [Streptomyces nodosus]|nr:hypothetical protein [Streptomyces nodosus]MBB4794606.1 hypothetical protein [Streptomyces nodosus]